MIETNPELVRVPLVARLEDSVATKLGRCMRCMTLSVAVLSLAWVLVVGSALTGPMTGPLFVAALAIAVPFTVLTLAHAVAFVARGPAAPHVVSVYPSAGSSVAAQPARRGCGCGGPSDESPDETD